MKGNLHHAHCSSYNLDEGGFIIVEMKEFVDIFIASTNQHGPRFQNQLTIRLRADSQRGAAKLTIARRKQGRVV